MTAVRPKPGYRALALLNPAAPSARGLVVACPMEGIGSTPNTSSFVPPWNLVDRTRPSFVASGIRPSYETGATGQNLFTALAGSGQMWFDHGSVSNRYFSAEVWVRFSAFRTTSPYISGLVNLGGTSGAAGSVGVIRLNSGSALADNDRIYTDWGYPTNELSLGVLYQIGVSTDGTTSRVVLDGRAILEGSTVPTAASFTRTFLFRDDQTSGRNPGAGIEAFHLWDRPLSPQEWAARAADPWAIYRTRRSPIAAALVLPPAFRPAWASQSTLTIGAP